MLIFTCIILLILAIIVFFIFGRNIKLLSYRISFVILLILLVIIGYFLVNVVCKTNKIAFTNSTQLSNTPTYNSNMEKKDLELYKSKSTIIVGSLAKLPPWYYTKNNVVLGYNIDLIKEAVKLMGKKIDIVIYNNDKELYSALKQKKIDIIADFGLINKDDSNFTYSIKIVNPPFVFVGNKQHCSKLLKNKENVKIPCENFLNKSIVTEDISFFTTSLYDLLGKNATFTVLSNSNDVLSSVEKNEFDIGFIEYFSFLSYKNTHLNSKLVIISPLISIKDREGLGFIVNSSDLVLQQQLNIALNLLKRRGEMSNLSINYFKEDVTL